MKMEMCIYLCAYASEYVMNASVYLFFFSLLFSLCVSFYFPSFTRQLSAECFLLISLVPFNVFFLIKWSNNQIIGIRILSLLSSNISVLRCRRTCDNHFKR